MIISLHLSKKKWKSLSPFWISFLRMDWTFVHVYTNFNPIHPRISTGNFGWNWHIELSISPEKKVLPFTKWCFQVPGLLEISHKFTYFNTWIYYQILQYTIFYMVKFKYIYIYICSIYFGLFLRRILHH